MRRQIQDAEIRPKTRFGRFRGNKRHKKIAADYESDERVIEHYREWLRFTRTKAADHLIVHLEDPVGIYSPDEWEEIARAYGRAPDS